MNDTPDITTANDDQVKYWNSASTNVWIKGRETMDYTLSSAADEVMARAAPQPGERVIDIGCGTGTTSLLLLEKIGQSGDLTGIDISAGMLGLARQRAAAKGFTNASFELADAQVHSFAKGATDLLASRFGVMFFSDPVAAFANMLTALKSGGRMMFAAWGPLSANPFFKIPRDAAIARLGHPAPTKPNAPGPLAFSDLDYTLGILKDAGFSDPAIDVVEIGISGQGSLDEMATRLVNVGPANRMMRACNGSEADAVAITETVRNALEPYDGPNGIRLPATLHMLRGTQP